MSINSGTRSPYSFFSKHLWIFTTDLKSIIDLSQEKAYQAINTDLVYRNWLIGYRISEEELKGVDRADYGSTIIKKVSNELTEEYGKGYTKTN
ncbi:MAG: DUF1016 N-terminal domain-containing protein [Longicatena sp.]